MRIIMFYHSLISDWNHGNAHFLRGVATELISLGHDVQIYEPENSWSVRNLLAEHGQAPLKTFRKAYPMLSSTRYRLETLDLTKALAGANLVIVHEWNDHCLVKAIGDHRARRRAANPYCLLFHDTHHRSITARQEMAGYKLSAYDGVLAFGRVIRDIYLKQKWARRAWVWHEAADTRVFHPQTRERPEGDLVWIGNWGDDERSAELNEYLIQPIKELGLRARIYGVRYPSAVLKQLKTAKIEYAGWLPNFKAPEIFSKFKMTVHVPRRPYVRALPGIPTIRPFEALACGIPLVSAPWNDCEGLFRAGDDYLVAKNGAAMKRQLTRVLGNTKLANKLANNGRETILKRHSCAHRVEQLLEIYGQIQGSRKVVMPARTEVA
jgi:spore maturation protein CgeB